MDRRTYLLERALNGELTEVETRELAHLERTTASIRRTRASWARVASALTESSSSKGKLPTAKMAYALTQATKTTEVSADGFRWWGWGLATAAVLVAMAVLGPRVVSSQDASPRWAQIHGEGSPVVVRFAPPGFEESGSPVEIQF